MIVLTSFFGLCREQVVNAAFPVLQDRDKMSLKISGKDEGNTLSRRMNGSYISYFGEKRILNTHPGRLYGGSSIAFAGDEELSGVGIEKISKVNGFEKTQKKNIFANLNGFEKMEKPNGMEKIHDVKIDSLDLESQKKRALQDDILLQWGQKKRSRCSRPEIKQATEGSPPPAEKIKQVERLLKNVEKQQLVVDQAHGSVQARIHTLRPPAQQTRQVGSSSARRNGHDLSAPLHGTSTSNKNDILSNARHSIPNTAERPSRRSSPDKKHTASGCPGDLENISASNGRAVPTSDFERDAIQSIPPTPQRVDLDLFEWPRFNISLSRKEKEEDFMIMKGCKLPQRPKRRPKLVEKAVHLCTPGNWLSDLNRSRYDVREKKCSKKKPRGLKAMESSDSDSE